jgi:hypothetical protein
VARINQFIEGGSLMFLARFESHSVLTMGSMNFIERELEGLTPDILLAGINGSRLGLYNYDERLVRVTGTPPVIIPTHWDSFALPYEFSQQANVEEADSVPRYCRRNFTGFAGSNTGAPGTIHS